MPAPVLSAAQLAEAQALADAIREAVAAETDQMAQALVATGAGHPFGPTEFTLRDLAHQVAAKALQQRLAQKKLGWQT